MELTTRCTVSIKASDQQISLYKQKMWVRRDISLLERLDKPWTILLQNNAFNPVKSRQGQIHIFVCYYIFFLYDQLRVGCLRIDSRNASIYLLKREELELLWIERLPKTKKNLIVILKTLFVVYLCYIHITLEYC